MILQKLLDFITWENIEELDPDFLHDGLVLNKIYQIVEDPLFDSEPGRAFEFYEKFEKIVQQAYGRIDHNSQISGTLLDQILAVISWKAFPAMPAKLKYYLIENGLVWGMGHEVDPKYFLARTLTLFENGFVPEKKIRREYVYALELNQEHIGENKLNFEGGIFAEPSVVNWLKLYNSTYPIRQDRGKFEKINFLNSSQNSLKLTKADRDILGRVLDIYDWLMFPPLGPIIVDEVSSKASTILREKNQPLESEYPSLNLGNDVVLKTESQPLAEVVPKAPPAVPKPVVPEKISMDEIIGSGSKSAVEAPSINRLSASAPIIPNLKNPLSAPLINADTLAAQMKKKAEQKQADSSQQIVDRGGDGQMQAKIDRKLHDLEDRVRQEKK